MAEFLRDLLGAEQLQELVGQPRHRLRVLVGQPTASVATPSSSGACPPSRSGLIQREIPTFDEIGMPYAVRELVELQRGLILFTGPTGSGKSTSMATLVDAINEKRPCHILTIEDPIEYLHRNKNAVVHQREVGIDAQSFERALKAALREDPDVVLVGEMRDPESIAITLTLAETGHLVLSSLHTNDAPQALDRIVDVFTADRQGQIRLQLASNAFGSRRAAPRAARRRRHHGRLRSADRDLAGAQPHS